MRRLSRVHDAEPKHLLECIETQVERLAALRAIDIAITGGPDLRLTLNTVLAQTVGQLGVDAAGVLLLDPETQLLTYAAGLGLRSEALQHTHLPLGAGHAARAALERKPARIADLRSEQTDFLRSPHFAREAFVSYYAVPLIAKGKVNGVLEIFQRAPQAQRQMTAARAHTALARLA